MQSYQSGSVDAFNLLYERHSGKVFGFLSNRIQKRKEAEDLLQEVFFKLHRSKHLYNKTLPFSPWLFSITRSVLLDFKKKKNLEDLVQESELDKMPHPEKQQVDHDLQGLVSQLPQIQSEALSLRVFEDKTFDEIASRLSTSPENARQLVSRGIKQLKRILGRKENEDGSQSER